MQKRRPTIIDVAKMAGVSKSTAGRALSGAANVTDEARERVLTAAKSVGYERNDLAVGMRSGRTGLLGLIIPDIANPFWAQVARGAQDRAAENGMSLLIFSSDWDQRREASHLRALRQARVDGAIINPVGDNFDDLNRFGLPFVLIGSSAERFPDISSVGSDIAQAVRTGMDHFVTNGHTAPALILGPKQRIARARFLRSFFEHCLERDVDPAISQVEDGEYTVEGGQAAMKRLLASRSDSHLAIFAANDLMALGALLAVREAGLSCPQDVSILGFDGVPAGAFSWPGLTTVAKPGREIGIRAVDCLYDEINGELERKHLFMPCQLIERGSLSDLKAKLPGQTTSVGRK